MDQMTQPTVSALKDDGQSTRSRASPTRLSSLTIKEKDVSEKFFNDKRHRGCSEDRAKPSNFSMKLSLELQFSTQFQINQLTDSIHYNEIADDTLCLTYFTIIQEVLGVTVKVKISEKILPLCSTIIKNFSYRSHATKINICIQKKDKDSSVLNGS